MGKCPYGKLSCKECKLWFAEFRLFATDSAGRPVVENGLPKVLQQGECSIVATAKFTHEILNRIATLRVQGPPQPQFVVPPGLLTRH